MDYVPESAVTGGCPVLILRADDPAIIAIALAIGRELAFHKGVVSVHHVYAVRDFRVACEDWLAARAEHPKLPDAS